MSLFYGWKAIDIFLPTEYISENPQSYPDDVKKYNTSVSIVSEQNAKWYWRFHQIWLNTLGSLAGWVSLYYLWFDKIIPNYPNYSLELSDIFFVIIALLGITGMLPSILSRLTSLK